MDTAIPEETRSLPPALMLATDDAIEFLARGDLDVLGRMPWSSNHTFLVSVCRNGTEGLAIYKPRRGERPLWDFSAGTLCAREVLAFELSEACGWDLVPPTVLRDGPLGEGSVQLFVEHDPDYHYLNLLDGNEDVFKRMAAFDFVANNADRKSGHCLLGRDRHIWGIDHGLCFNDQPKLRTVIWDFAGERLPADVTAGLDAAIGALCAELGDRTLALLSSDEANSTLRRAERIMAAGRFPEPRSDYPYPWPLV